MNNKMNKKSLAVLTVSILTVGIIIFFVFKKLQGLVPISEQPELQNVPTITPEEKEDPALNAEQKNFMRNNVSGIITKSNNTSVTLDTSEGQKVYNIDENSFVYTIKDKIKNKNISDLKSGMSVNLQFDPETSSILTITIQ